MFLKLFDDFVGFLFGICNNYAKKYPEQKNELVRGAKICGYGRVVAGLHYPSDYDAGIELAHKLMDFMNYDKF